MANALNEFPLERLEELTVNYQTKHEDNGGRSEFDRSINYLSWAKLDVYKKQYGTTFLGKLDFYDCEEPEDRKIELVAYIGQKIPEFSYDFAVPAVDEVLIHYLKEYVRAKGKETIQSKKDRVEKRIREIRGIFLFWS